jgi:hypothetical protein
MCGRRRDRRPARRGVRESPRGRGWRDVPQVARGRDRRTAGAAGRGLRSAANRQDGARSPSCAAPRPGRAHARARAGHECSRTLRRAARRRRHRAPAPRRCRHRTHRSGSRRCRWRRRIPPARPCMPSMPPPTARRRRPPSNAPRRGSRGRRDDETSRRRTASRGPRNARSPARRGCRASTRHHRAPRPRCVPPLESGSPVQPDRSGGSAMGGRRPHPLDLGDFVVEACEAEADHVVCCLTAHTNRWTPTASRATTSAGSGIAAISSRTAAATRL